MVQPRPELVDVITRLERLECTVAVLVGAAIEDACQGLTPEQLGESRAAAVEAMVATANRLRTAS